MNAPSNWSFRTEKSRSKADNDGNFQNLDNVVCLHVKPPEKKGLQPHLARATNKLRHQPLILQQPPANHRPLTNPVSLPQQCLIFLAQCVVSKNEIRPEATRYIIKPTISLRFQHCPTALSPLSPLALPWRFLFQHSSLTQGLHYAADSSKSGFTSPNSMLLSSSPC